MKCAFKILVFSILFCISSSLDLKAKEAYEDSDWLIGSSMATSVYFGGSGGLLGIVNFQLCCAYSQDNACNLEGQSDGEGCNSARQNEKLIALRYL